MEICGETSATCAECGASAVGGLNCWDQLGAVLAWEWQDPELFALHFVTVASYNLQHPAQFTDAALAGLKKAYEDYLDGAVSVSQIRARVNAAVNGAVRVKKLPEERRPVLRRFEMTIADVYQSGHPEGAAERVRAWARAIRREMVEGR